MKKARLPHNERERMLDLYRLELLDTGPEDLFDTCTKLISEVCEVPVCLISLVDENRQWFKSKVGLKTYEIARDVAFCSHTILQDEPFIIEDARQDHRFKNNPLVTGKPHIIFYAGIPLKTSLHHNIGTLCIIDHRPRKFSKQQIEYLKKMAKVIMIQIETRYQLLKKNTYSKMMEEIHVLNNQKFQNEKQLFKEYLKKGCEIFDMEFAIVSEVKNNTYTVAEAISPNNELMAGLKFDLTDTFCQVVISEQASVAVGEAGKDKKFNMISCYENMKLESYIATPIYRNDRVYGTLNFSSKKSRPHGFSSEEKRFIEIMGQIVSRHLDMWLIEHEKQKSIEDYRLILDIIDTSADYVAIYDILNNEYIYRNINLMGLTQSFESSELVDIHPEAEKEKMLGYIIPYVRKNGVWKGESMIMDENNQHKPIYITMRAHKEKSGEVRYISKVFQDITQLKGLEEEIDFHQQRLRIAVSAASIGIWDWDINSNKLYWEPSMYPLYGLPPRPSHLLYQSWIETISNEDRERVIKEMDQAIQSSSDFKSEYKIIHATTGEERFISTEARVMVDDHNRPIRMIGANWDVTDKRKYKDELESSLARFKMLTDLAPAGIFLTDAKGKATYLNKAWLKMAGMSAEEAIGSGWARAIHEDDKEECFNKWYLAAEKNIKFEHEMRFKNIQDNSITYVSSKVAPIMNQNNEIFGYIGINIDVTKKHDALETLKEATLVAQKASQAKSQFLANMSHEIRTPLNSIVGLSDLLSQSKLNEEYAGYVRTLQSSSEVLLNLVNDILDFSKIEAGEMQLDRDEFDFEDIFEDMMELFAFQIREKRLDLNYYIRKEIKTTYMGDVNRIKQILINLIGNAIKFTNEGNIDISLHENFMDGKESGVLIKVADTGIGMNKENLKKIFEMFNQGDQSTTKKIGGTGLGLAIAKKLVELMDGKIWVESKTEKGSVFYFTLVLDKAAKKRSSINYSNFKNQNLKVLIVDDNLKNLDTLKRTVKNWGLSVNTANSYQEAYERVQKEEFDLIITDYQLAETEANGYQLVKTLLNEKLVKRGHYIVLTSIEDTGISDSVHDLDGQIVIKPYRRWDLHQKINLFLGRANNQYEMLPAEVGPKKKAKWKTSGVRDFKILIVDDAANNRALVKAYLKNYNFDIVEAENGIQALAAMKKQQFDLVFMDMQMPEMDGLTATLRYRKYQKAENLPHVPILALSAYAMKEEQQKSLKAGCDMHITKPIKKDELLEIINNYLPLKKVA